MPDPTPERIPMAEPLKNSYGAEIPRTIAEMVSAVDSDFERKAFLLDALRGYKALELMDRGRKISASLRRHLPPDYPEAVAILVASTRVEMERTEHAMASFLFMPHLQFVGAYGLEHFEESMDAQYELTRKFTAEFSIRPFLIRHQDATLERLRGWARDPNAHVRRLVSEGTRPRLPWAPRLPEFHVFNLDETYLCSRQAMPPFRRGSYQLTFLSPPCRPGGTEAANP